ncbi:MAG: DUF2141 domain-containing protein [Deltaproteobacteria bacterium]|nr:DUF2141 domain-containing protein [Deltaproteobacteria bacterium]MBW2445520.1 DUF2141 domain-containing protein [Deltaproteobacteria bacterium]
MSRTVAWNPSSLRHRGPVALARRVALAALLALACGFAAPASADAPAEAATAGTLRVVPVGLESSKGNLIVQLAASAHDFEADAEGFRYLIIKIENKQAEAVFEGIPHGEYAIKIFHDENANEKLDTNFIGVPKERFGFSNDAMGRFGPPSYDQARFVFQDEQATIEIKIRGLR